MNTESNVRSSNDSSFEQRCASIISVTSGKGGVGKTQICANLAVSIAEMGNKVCIVDADHGLANINIVLGISATQTSTKQTDEAAFNQIYNLYDPLPFVLQTNLGVDLLPAKSGLSSNTLTQPSAIQIKNMLDSLSLSYDVILIDTAAGIDDKVKNYIAASDKTLVIINSEPTSLTDSFGLIRTMQDVSESFEIVVNRVSGANPASKIYKRFASAVKKYIGTVVPKKDNFYAALNSAVFSDGSFCYIPKGVRCPMELSTYFRINEGGTGQFERTLVVADKGSYVSYLEGCTAPQRDENQLHAAVVELIAMDDAEIKYSTVQNWFPGDENGKGGVFNFVTKRGLCETNAKISWTQVETGSAVTWKYPSCILKGNNSVGEFYSIAVTNHYQQADTGTKMIHLGKNTKSTIISKGISAGKSQNSYRGLVQINSRAENARNFSQCDSLLMGNACGAHTFPYIEVKNKSAQIEHEATTSKIGEEQLFYCNQRGIDTEKAIALIVNGFSKEVLNKLPMEFAVEAQKLLEISLEGSVG